MSASYLALLEVTRIPIREFNLNPATGIELYRRGRPLLREMFGSEVSLGGPATPHISYGHINGLGVGLVFPEGGEVNYDRSERSLEELVGMLEREGDFASAGMAPFFLDYQARLARAFPGEIIYFSYGAEGPITTAYTLRDMKVFLDPYDQPELFERFLSLTVRSIVAFRRFLANLRSTSAFNPTGVGLCDDVASMFSPDMWPHFVLPYWEEYYRAQTSGKRSAHVEDLRPDHLPLLEAIGLSDYDPSISPKINPRTIRERCRVPFSWRLANFHYPALSVEEVGEFVFQAVADGASSVFTVVCATMCNEPTVRKVRAFIEAAKTAERMLGEGTTRGRIGGLVSLRGRKRFWAN